MALRHGIKILGTSNSPSPCAHLRQFRSLSPIKFDAEHEATPYKNMVRPYTVCEKRPDTIKLSEKIRLASTLTAYTGAKTDTTYKKSKTNKNKVSLQMNKRYSSSTRKRETKETKKSSEYDVIEQYELEAAEPRDKNKTFDIVQYLSDMNRNQPSRDFDHLQPGNLRPYGSTHNVVFPESLKPRDAINVKYPVRYVGPVDLTKAQTALNKKNKTRKYSTSNNFIKTAPLNMPVYLPSKSSYVDPNNIKNIVQNPLKRPEIRDPKIYSYDKMECERKRPKHPHPTEYCPEDEARKKKMIDCPFQKKHKKLPPLDPKDCPCIEPPPPCDTPPLKRLNLNVCEPEPKCPPQPCDDIPRADIDCWEYMPCTGHSCKTIPRKIKDKKCDHKKAKEKIRKNKQKSKCKPGQRDYSTCVSSPAVKCASLPDLSYEFKCNKSNFKRDGSSMKSYRSTFEESSIKKLANAWKKKYAQNFNDEINSDNYKKVNFLPRSKSISLLKNLDKEPLNIKPINTNKFYSTTEKNKMNYNKRLSSDGLSQFASNCKWKPPVMTPFINSPDWKNVSTMSSKKNKTVVKSAQEKTPKNQKSKPDALKGKRFLQKKISIPFRYHPTTFKARKCHYSTLVDKKSLSINSLLRNTDVGIPEFSNYVLSNIIPKLFVAKCKEASLKSKTMHPLINNTFFKNRPCIRLSSYSKPLVPTISYRYMSTWFKKLPYDNCLEEKTRSASNWGEPKRKRLTQSTKHLQPANQKSSEINNIFQPPPPNKKFDPKKAEECLRRKHGIPNLGKTVCCNEFYTKDKRIKFINSMKGLEEKVDLNCEKEDNCSQSWVKEEPEENCWWVKQEKEEEETNKCCPNEESDQVIKHKKYQFKNKDTKLNQECMKEEEEKEEEEECCFDNEENIDECCEDKRPVPCQPFFKRIFLGVVNYFRARPGCPTVEECKQMQLVEKARKAAEKAGLALCQPEKPCELPKVITVKYCKKKKKVCCRPLVSSDKKCYSTWRSLYEYNLKQNIKKNRQRKRKSNKDYEMLKDFTENIQKNKSLYDNHNEINFGNDSVIFSCKLPYTNEDNSELPKLILKNKELLDKLEKIYNDVNFTKDEDITETNKKILKEFKKIIDEEEEKHKE